MTNLTDGASASAFRKSNLASPPYRFLMPALLVVLLSTLFSCKQSPVDETAIKKAVKAELHRYPEATLQDLYKFFFQGAWGPGHIIKNEQAAADHLDVELRAAKTYNPILWQPVGYQHRYYRINLKVVADSLIDRETYLKAFIESANGATPPTLAQWQQQWSQILAVIESMPEAKRIPDFAKDRSFLNERLSQKKPVVHHSPFFANAYHPHYRIVDKKHFDILKQKFASETTPDR